MRRRGFLSLTAGAIAAPAFASETTMSACCPVVELRQYIMQPGRRDEMVALFEREFIESQEALGARVIGTFKDLDRPDRFVWLRGFADMEARLAALQGFYGSDHWRAHRAAANATIVDNDDVLLLKPAAPHAAFDLPTARAPVGTARPGKGLIEANLWYLADADEAGFAAMFETTLAPLLAAHGITPIAWFIGEHSENTFPALPVREGERLLAWFAAFDSVADHGKTRAAMEAATSWPSAYASATRRFARLPERFRLEPTARSALHG